MDWSQATREELLDQLNGVQQFLDALINSAPLGQPLDPRAEENVVELQQIIESIRAELDKRNFDATAH